MIGPGLFRLILALIVLIHHITRYVFIGTFAVYVFFILSGYWVTKMYVEKYSKSENPLMVFYISRSWRLLPVYFLALISILPLLYIYRPESLKYISTLAYPEKLLYLFSNIFLFGYNSFQHKLIVPAWSLDIEMQFYFVLPLIAFILPRTNLKMITVTSFLVSLFLLYNDSSGLELTLFRYMPFFLVGILIYQGVTFFKIPYAVSLILVGTVLALHYIIPSLAAVTVQNKNSFYNEVLNYVLAVAMIPFVRANVKHRSGRADKALGDLSYIVYLFHWVFYIPYVYYVEKFSFKERLPYLFAYLIITVGASWVIYVLFDRKMDKLRSIWVKSKMAGKQNQLSGKMTSS